MGLRELSRAARLYITAVVLGGIGAIAESGYRLIADPVDHRWLVLAALTLFSASANVRLTAVSATISVSETFVFTSVLLFGPAAGTLTVGFEAFVLSLWLKGEARAALHRVLFNIAVPALSIWVAAHIFFWLLGRPPLSTYDGVVRIVDVAVPLLAFTLVYFLLNSWLIAFAISLAEHASALAVWKHGLLWLLLNYFGGASVAALLVGYRGTFDVALLLVIAPILIVLHFTMRTVLGRVEDANQHLARVNRLYLSTIETLATAIDAKDQVTHGHIRRVQIFAVELAKVLGVREADQIRAIEAAALLHDMGKLAVPEHILNKPGPLNESELERMRTHAAIGADILSFINFPYPVVPIVRHHHENWDGTGYPAGLKGTEIPVGARILSVVDCFDALTSDRPYRPRLSSNEALEILVARRGKMYDPLVVDAFVSLLGRLPLEPHQVSAGVMGALTKEPVRPLKPAEVISTRLMDGAQLSLNSLVRRGNATVAVFFVSDRDATRLKATVTAGSLDPCVGALEINVGDKITGWVAANGRAIVNSDPALDLGLEVAARLQLGNAASVPAKIGMPGPVSVLTTYSKRGTSFSAADLDEITQCAKYLEALMADPISS